MVYKRTADPPTGKDPAPKHPGSNRDRETDEQVLIAGDEGMAKGKRPEAVSAEQKKVQKKK